MSDTNFKKKPTDGLIPVKTYIRNDGDGDDDEMSFMGSPPLLPFDDPAEYKKLRQAASKSMPADFLGQFCGRMLTDALWETRRYQLVATNIIKADLARYPEIEDPEARVAHVVADRLDALERLYRIIGCREHRADAVHRLAEQHRTNLGKLLPSTAEQVQDAEFQEVDDNAADGNQLKSQPAHEDRS
jgi:hypothetical protein